MPTEWAHTPIDSAPPAQPVDVRVQMPVMKGVKVYLYYRAPGQAEFASVLMKRRGAEKVGRIPASEMNGKSVQYYIEAKDPTGNVVKNSGSPSDPNIVMIDASAKPQIAMKEGGAEESSAEEAEPPQKMSRREERRLEEEAAPLGPEERKKKERSHPFLPSGRRDDRSHPRAIGTLGIVGAALAGVGVLAIGAGIPALYYGGVVPNQNAVQSDANQGTNIGCSTTPCVFNDPNASPNDYDFQQRAKLYNYLEYGFLGLGVAAIGTGVALFTLDYIRNHPSQPKPKRHRRRRRPVEEEYQEEPPPGEAAPPSDDRPPAPETSSIHNFFAAPMLTPNQAGVGLGFQF
jgi:hypothetical protein